VAALHISLLRKKYPADYLELLKEKSPEGYERVVARIKNLEQKQSEHTVKKLKTEEVLRSDWIQAGGMD